MKKLFLFLTLSILLVSCSSDSEENIPNEVPKLLLKIEQIDNESTTDVYYNSFNYNSNHILTEVDAAGILTITPFYDDNGNIIELKQSRGTTEKYEYIDGKLSKHTRLVNDLISEIKEYFYDGNIITSSRTTSYDQSVINFSYEYLPDNRIKITSDDPSYEDYRITTYDNKNIPAAGVDYLKKIVPFSNYGNPIKEQIYRSGRLDLERTYENSYDSDNFPTKMIIQDASSNGEIFNEIRKYTYNK